MCVWGVCRVRWVLSARAHSRVCVSTFLLVRANELRVIRCALPAVLCYLPLAMYLSPCATRLVYTTLYM